MWLKIKKNNYTQKVKLEYFNFKRVNSISNSSYITLYKTINYKIE